MDLSQALSVSASGMNAQTARLRVVSENLANQNTTGSTPGAKAYHRKTISFESHLDRKEGLNLVRVKGVGRDNTSITSKYDPGHPAADAKGYVEVSNVNSFLELMDARESERSYNANLAAMQATRGMITRTIEILK